MNKLELTKLIKELEEKAKEYIELMKLTKKIGEDKTYSGIYGIDEYHLTFLIENGYDDNSDWLKVNCDLLFDSDKWKREVTDVISQITLTLKLAEKTKNLIKQQQKEAKERASYERLKKKFENVL